MKYKRRLAEARGLPFVNNNTVIERPALGLLPSAHQVRFGGYKRFARGAAVRSGIVDVTQTVGYTKKIQQVVPTLLRRSCLVDLASGKVLLPSAHFDVMGVPVHRLPSVPFRCPFESLLSKMSCQDMKHLCGNSMHAAAAGMCLLYVLSCIEAVHPTDSSP